MNQLVQAKTCGRRLIQLLQKLRNGLKKGWKIPQRQVVPITLRLNNRWHC